MQKKLYGYTLQRVKRNTKIILLTKNRAMKKIEKKKMESANVRI